MLPIDVREDGFYFIKQHCRADWEVAQWDSENKSWALLFEDLPILDEDILQINETKILPPQN